MLFNHGIKPRFRLPVPILVAFLGDYPCTALHIISTAYTQMNIKPIGIESEADARNLLAFSRHLAPMPVILPNGCRKLFIFINPFRYARLQRLVHFLSPGTYPTIECRNRFRILLPLELLRKPVSPSIVMSSGNLSASRFFLLHQLLRLLFCDNRSACAPMLQKYPRPLIRKRTQKNRLSITDHRLLKCKKKCFLENILYGKVIQTTILMRQNLAVSICSRTYMAHDVILFAHASSQNQ